MSGRVGIWMDHHEATIVRLPDAGEAGSPEVRTITSDVESRHRAPGGSVFPGQVHGAGAGEDTRMLHRRERDLARYHDEIRDAVRDADAIVLLGPGEARKGFAKHLTEDSDAQHLPPVVVNEACDRITGNEVVEKVREAFDAPPPRSGPARIWSGLGG